MLNSASLSDAGQNSIFNIRFQARRMIISMLNLASLSDAGQNSIFSVYHLYLPLLVISTWVYIEGLREKNVNNVSRLVS